MSGCARRIAHDQCRAAPGNQRAGRTDAGGRDQCQPIKRSERTGPYGSPPSWHSSQIRARRAVAAMMDACCDPSLTVRARPPPPTAILRRSCHFGAGHAVLKM
jgi:hypothetical protein